MYPAETIRRVCDDVKRRGISRKDAAAAAGVSTSILSVWLRRLEAGEPLQRPSGRAKLTPRGRQLLCSRIREQGWTPQAAATAAGVTRQAAMFWLPRYDAGEPLIDRQTIREPGAASPSPDPKHVGHGQHAVQGDGPAATERLPEDRVPVHPNAPLFPSGRRALCERVRVHGWTVKAAAAAAGMSERRTYEWLSRYDAGEPMSDRPSRRH